MIQRVADLKTEPIVGELYLVPCARFSLRETGMKRFIWMPVLGPEHDDKEIIGFSKRHWHYDFRFVKLCHYRDGARRITANEFFHVFVRTFDGPVEERIRKCWRRMPDYETNGALFIPRLEVAYADAQVIVKDGCRLCPHRGLPLNGLPKEKDGAVTCRGHGLRWKKNGKLAPRNAS